MANKVTLELNSDGVRELLRSKEMMDIVEGYAQDIANRCGDGYEVSTYTGTNRVNASVLTATWEAYKDNLDNNTILKAVR